MNIYPIATVQTPFKEKFGIPRQSVLIKHAEGRLVFTPPYDNPDAFIGLEGFSHIWLQFGFHKNIREEFKPSVRPPRLGGNESIGVFATRSSFRPNALGLSLVKLIEIQTEKGSTSLVISCPDLLDGTPIYDIKPYVEYSDLPEAPLSGFANSAPEPELKVKFTRKTADFLEKQPTIKACKDVKRFLEEIIGLDPRPAYHKECVKRDYGMRIFDLEVKWVVEKEVAIVTNINQTD
jgi:tRNA (adenine37-N6)-methyltransferase